MKNKNIIVSVLIVVVFGVIGYFLINNSTLKNTSKDPVDMGAQGKIDINAICDGALAYVTFPDGASADKFVAECKEGKHPQVIEDFKKQMNLGDGANL